MEDDKLKDDQAQEENLEKNSDSDYVYQFLADKSEELALYSHALEMITDPMLKEILSAISEDVQKHQSALEQWLQMSDGDLYDDDENEGDDDENEGDGDEPMEIGEIPEDLDKDEDPIEDIRSVLEQRELPGEDDGDKDDESIKKNFRVPFVAKSADQMIVYGVVSEPDTIDLQGDRLSREEIEKACHRFMQTSQKIGKEHGGPAKADIIESYIAPTDFVCGGQTVRKGSWVMAVKVHDPDLWRAIKAGDITGFSIAGKGKRTPFLG